MRAEISLEEALSRFESSDRREESRFGMKVLFGQYVNSTQAWDAFVEHVVNRPSKDIQRQLIYYLAHIPWHPDIAWTGDIQISTETRAYGRQLLRKRFGLQEVIKLLECIDENGIERGSVGQSVVAVIGCVDQIGPILANIARNSSLPIGTREFATLIIAKREGIGAILILTELAHNGSKFASEIISQLLLNGAI